MLYKNPESAYTEGRRKGMRIMAQTMVNFRMDSELKQSMEQACAEMGLSMTTAFTIFAKTVSRERRIPFEVTAEPFYSRSNMEHLRRGAAALDAGKGVVHELIEDPDDV
jgi:DNA-damage-inducible protein J